MRKFQVLFDDAEPSLIEHAGYAPYGGLGFPAPHSDRPWTYANFVQSIDGIASFKGRHAAGSDISQSADDRWLMDLLRAHADAIIMGVNTLVEETRSWPEINAGRGPVYSIEDPVLRELRNKIGRKAEKVIFVTASGAIDPRAYRVFDGDLMEAFVLTTTTGAARLKAAKATVRAIVAGHDKTEEKTEDKTIDLQRAVRFLHAEMGIRYLLCEGGPTLYGSMARAGVIDEKFVTVSPVEIGLYAPTEQATAGTKASSPPDLRPTTFTFPGFTQDNAPWFHWMSCRRAGDHQFNRYRRK